MERVWPIIWFALIGACLLVLFGCAGPTGGAVKLSEGATASGVDTGGKDRSPTIAPKGDGAKAETAITYGIQPRVIVQVGIIVACLGIAVGCVGWAAPAPPDTRLVLVFYGGAALAVVAGFYFTHAFFLAAPA